MDTQKIGVARFLLICFALMGRYVAAQPSLAGLSLEAAIEALEGEGLAVFYSTELVKPTMRVIEQPAGRDAREWLRAILAPHGLTIASGPRGSLLIVPEPAGKVVRADPPPPVPREPAPPPETAELTRIDELVVSSSRYKIVGGAGAEGFLIASGELERLPDLGDDALRAVQRLPGTAANGFSAHSNVRGGAADEALVRLDGLRLYDPVHLENFQSVFGAIDPRVVGTMEVYTGAFPAAFGDRLSGVVDITSLTPPDARYTELSVSFFNASLLSAGTLGNGDGEWVASVRRGNLDVLYDAFSKRPERPHYVDGFGRVAYQLTDTLRASVNALYSRDDVELFDDLDAEERATSQDEDRYLWLRFDHTGSERFRGSTLVAHAALSGDRAGVRDKQGIGSGRLADRREFRIDTLQTDWSWQPYSAGSWLVQFGAAFDRSRGRYDYEDDAAFEVLFATPGAPPWPLRARDIELAAQGEHRAVYGSVRYRPTSRVTMDLGVRWDAQTLDPEHTGVLAPRASLRYRLGERSYLRAGWGRFGQAQAINELPISDGVRTFLPPQRAEHRVLGFEHLFAGGIELRVEAYDKKMSHLRPRYENLLQPRSLLPELEPDRVRIAPESATARGVEMRVDGPRAAALRWWGSYARSSVRDRIGGVEVSRNWDQIHALSGGLGWTTPLWDVSAALTQHSGWPTTAVLGLDESRAIPRVVTGPRNAERLGEFRSVDLRVTRTFATRNGELAAFLELTNAFGRRNPCCLEYQLEGEEGEAPVLELSPLDYLPRVPSLGFVWSF